MLLTGQQQKKLMRRHTSYISDKKRLPRANKNSRLSEINNERVFFSREEREKSKEENKQNRTKKNKKNRTRKKNEAHLDEHTLQSVAAPE